MYRETDLEDTVLAKVQGTVFEKSCGLGLDSRKFIEAYI